MRALAVDLGGTHVAYGVVEDRRLVFHETFEVVSATTLCSVLATLQDQLQRAQKMFGACDGLAMGFPCIVDTSTNRVLSALKKYEDATDIDLPGWCRDRLNLDLKVENDARLALLGEHYAGAGRGEESLVMMTLGTGIGTAAIIENRLRRKGQKLPDALLLRSGTAHVVEFGGAYSKEKLRAFHSYCQQQELSYEIW